MSRKRKGKSTKDGRPARVDYFDDPGAPKATSRKPSASVVMRDQAGAVLLLKRADNGLWTIPTGGLKRNETIRDCAVRECREETGLDIEITGLVGVYSDPRHVIAYADGEVRQPVNICLHARPVGGRLTTTAEAVEVRWIRPDQLDDYPMAAPLRRRVEDGLAGGPPHVD